ncbi:MAG TPA: hypothetical protein VK675_04065 [Candidatus Paceibacterota bacterium]|nr:hypothetical protein [Candidatus Paceibacterota bacterium]
MQIMRKNWLKLILLSYAFFTPFFMLYAVDTCDPGKICNPIEATSLNGLIKSLLEGVIRVGLPIVALAIIYCGFLFVSARGNPQELTKAKNALLYTLIGAAILIGSWAIAQLISETVLAL